MFEGQPQLPIKIITLIKTRFKIRNIRSYHQIRFFLYKKYKKCNNNYSHYKDYTEELRIIDFGLGCIKQSVKFPCQKFRGATQFYYPQGPELTTFQEWKKADQEALQIVENTFC